MGGVEVSSLVGGNKLVAGDGIAQPARTVDAGSKRRQPPVIAYAARRIVTIGRCLGFDRTAISDSRH